MLDGVIHPSPDTWCEKPPYSEFFWSVFSHIWTEYGEMLHISPHSVRTWESTDQKNSELRRILRSGVFSTYPIGKLYLKIQLALFQEETYNTPLLATFLHDNNLQCQYTKNPSQTSLLLLICENNYLNLQ